MPPFRLHRLLAAAAIAAVLSGACRGSEQAQPAAATQPSAAGALPPPAVSLAALPKIEAAPILERIKLLSSDKLQGRAPGTLGEELTVGYLESQFKEGGLQPGNPDGSYMQKVPVVGTTGAEARPLTITKPGETGRLKWRDDVVAWTKHVADGASIDKSDIVFAGYGVEAPEYGWDDFKGIDVKGKTIVVLVNDPP